MSTEPYTPGESSLVAAYRAFAARIVDDADLEEVTAEARRGIANIKAAAWYEGHKAGYQDAQEYHTAMGDGCGPDWWDCGCLSPYLPQEDGNE